MQRLRQPLQAREQEERPQPRLLPLHQRGRQRPTQHRHRLQERRHWQPRLCRPLSAHPAAQAGWLIA